MILLIVIMIIATVLIVTVIIVIVIIVILVIVFLVMLVIVSKIMCMLILVCVKKCLISFLEVEVLITVQKNGRIYFIFKCQCLIWYSILGGYYGSSSIDYTYCYLANNGHCSIGSNRIVLLQPRASMLKKQQDRPAGLAQPMKIIISYLNIMISIVKSKLIIILQYNNALVKSYRYLKYSSFI